MMRKVALAVLTLSAVACAATAEDPKERAYFVPALHPQHKDKPKVSGWARERVEERLNRGLLAMPEKDGQVYVGWRLLKTDPRGTVFNVYRAVDGGAPMRAEPAAAGPHHRLHRPEADPRQPVQLLGQGGRGGQGA